MGKKQKKIELVLEKRSENSFRRWVPRARGVNDCSIKNDKHASARKQQAGWQKETPGGRDEGEREKAHKKFD